MKINLKEVLAKPYAVKIEYSPNDECWIASFDDDVFNKKNLVIGTGDSRDEALKELFNSFECYALNVENEPNLTLPRLITHATAPDKAKNLTITIKESILNEMDEMAEKLGISRSAFIALSAKHYIKNYN